jgi:hypothetical protein
MKHLKPFSLLESESSNNLTQEQEDFLNRYTLGTWSLFPATGLVDVQGSFDCSGRNLKSLVGIQFGMVTGNFTCNNNLLTSLVGAPQKVGGGFNCAVNHLTSLAGAPQTVRDDFQCSRNLLTSLVGAPQTVRGFSCNNNQLTSLEGATQKVGGNFYCSFNPLNSLVGAPQTVGGYFLCDAFRLIPDEWNPKGWLQVLREGDPAACRLILTLPAFDAQFWLGRLKGDLKQDGQTLLQLADMWGREGWEEEQAKLQQELNSNQLRAIKALRTKLIYVNPWQDFKL